MPLAIAFGIAFLIASGAFVLDHQRTLSYRAKLQATAESTMNNLLQQLMRRLESDLLIADHLSHVFRYSSTQFSMDQFAPIARDMLQRTPHATAVVIAPDNRISHIITRQGILTMDKGGTSAALPGVDLAALGKRIGTFGSDGRSLLAGEAHDNTLTLTIPVQSDTGRWGSLAMVIDEHQFMRDSGVNPETASIDLREVTSRGWLNVAIRHVGDGSSTILTGEPAIFDQSPLTWTLPVSGGRWEVMAAPRDGWQSSPPDQSSHRLFLMLAGLGMIVPVFVASLLVAERNRHIAMLKARETNLLQLSQKFNLAMETANIGIWEVTGDNHLSWDDRAAMLHGKPVDHGSSRLTDWLASVHPHDVDAAEAHFFTCICSSNPCTQIYRVKLEEGEIRTLRSAGATYRGSDGTTRTTGIVWDITSDMMVNQTLRDAKENSDIKNAELELALDELSNREQELEEISSRLSLALASYNCGIWESNPLTRTELWDPRMCQLYGIPFGDGRISAQRWLTLIHPDDREMAEAISPKFPHSMRETLTVRVPQPDGSTRFVRSFGKAHTMRDGSVKIVGIAFDVTDDMRLTQQLQAAKYEAEAKNVELVQAKHRIEHNALHDPLTQLANRRKLDVELDALAQDSLTERLEVSILHLDLDRFKQINDTLGHAAGDAMLMHAARILTKNVGEGDVVARIGGDEFVIVVRDGSDADTVAELSNRIITELRQPLNFDGFSCRCGVSIGIAQASGMRIDARRTLINADIALYRAKRQGRNRYEFFTHNLQAEIINHKRTADELLTGLENHEFATWYQPQFCAHSMKLIGVEALVRWNHPYRGLLTPDAFLAIAEDLNVSAAIDQVVLETVLKDQMRWQAQGVVVPRVSVNVSSKRLKDESLIATLETLSIRPGQIAFELVESIFLDESEDLVTQNLERIKALGIDIEIDDFGTGHTSIVSLLKLKPKRLKIDRQLVMPILSSPQERSLVRSIIEIARSLGVETVAEGVETMEHASLLRQLGCDMLQGYAFARPLSFADFSEGARRGFRKAA